jgi:hypothetical protein
LSFWSQTVAHREGPQRSSNRPNMISREDMVLFIGEQIIGFDNNASYRVLRLRSVQLHVAIHVDDEDYFDHKNIK